MRRHAMGLALTGLILAGCGGDNGGDPIVVETFRNPPELKSANGELRTVFTVGTSTFQVDGRTVTSSVYNNAYIPQVLRLRPGDTLFLDLDNRITEQTNLHFHGLNVSPRINRRWHRFGQHLRDTSIPAHGSTTASRFPPTTTRVSTGTTRTGTSWPSGR